MIWSVLIAVVEVILLQCVGKKYVSENNQETTTGCYFKYVQKSLYVDGSKISLIFGKRARENLSLWTGEPPVFLKNHCHSLFYIFRAKSVNRRGLYKPCSSCIDVKLWYLIRHTHVTSGSPLGSWGWDEKFTELTWLELHYKKEENCQLEILNKFLILDQ